MKTISRFWAAIAVSAGLFSGCADLKEFHNKVDELDGRVTALETITTNLNNNIAALQAFYGGATINSATKDNNDVWTLVLSNGETLTLTQGSIGVANAPVMSVDKDGYWMVDYDGDGGNAPVYIMNGNDKVLALGTDGFTPEFGIDADKYWTVSYDGGKTFDRVLDSDKQPVSALPSAEITDPYFADVKMENGQFKISLHTGEELVIPVISNFLCTIDVEGLQVFNSGESKLYNVIVKGVKSTMITAPAGWTAALSESVYEQSVLTVTAPIAVKSAIADSRTDICILAFSDQGLATIAKMQVSASDVPVVANPAAHITPGEATESTLTYNVVVSDVTSWKYLHLKKDQSAPDAETIAAEGITGSETTLTIENLDPSTAYVLYVLPINEEAQGAVVGAENMTTAKAITSYYKEWDDGKDIIIGGITFNKSMFKEITAELVDTDKEIKEDGIWFIKENVTVTYSGSVKGVALIIGDKPGKRSNIKLSSQLGLNNSEVINYATFHNVNFDASQLNQYFIAVNADGNFEYLIFDDCKIIPSNDNSMHYNGNDKKRGIEKFIMIDSELQTPENQSNYALINAPKGQNYNYMTLKNNIIYSGNSEADVKFTIWQGFTQGYSSTCEHLIFENNTIVNLLHNNGYLRVSNLNKADIQNNLLVYKKSLSSAIYMLRPEVTYPATGTIRNNIGYAVGNHFLVFYTPNKNQIADAEDVTALESDPFDKGTFDLVNGKFVPETEYISYGAQR